MGCYQTIILLIVHAVGLTAHQRKVFFFLEKENGRFIEHYLLHALLLSSRASRGSRASPKKQIRAPSCETWGEFFSTLRPCYRALVPRSARSARFFSKAPGRDRELFPRFHGTRVPAPPAPPCAPLLPIPFLLPPARHEFQYTLICSTWYGKLSNEHPSSCA